MMRTRISLVAVVFALSLTLNPSADGVTINFQEGLSPTAGYQSIVATLNQTSPDGQGATGASNYIGHAGTSANSAFRSAMGFPLTGIPAGSTINSVTLTLYGRGAAVSGASSTAYTIEIHELTGSIIETGPTWNNRFDDPPAGAGGTDVAWATAGGDFSSTVLSSLSAAPSGVTLNAPYLFSSSAAFVAAAQNALDGSGTLYMLGLAPAGELAAGETRFNFGSDDFATAALRPLLTIDYAPVPEPISVFILGLGITGVALLKRRMQKSVAVA